MIMNQEKLENIIEKVLLAHKSAVWWQSEMRKCLSEVEELDEADPYGVDSGEERVALEERVENLIRKGEWEDSNLDNIMAQMEFFEDEDKRHIVSELTRRWALEKETK